MRREQTAAEVIADDVVTETLLRCWLRESGPVPPITAEGAVELRLPASGLTVRVALTHRSPTGWHRFSAPALLPADGTASPLDSGLLAALLVREITAELGRPAAAGSEALGRIVDSARRIAGHLDARRSSADPARSAPFLSAERAPLTGHPFHPAGASRQGASDRAMAAYSPERAGSFSLHWFAAHPSVLDMSGQAAGAARQAGRGTAERLLTALFRDSGDLQQGASPDRPDGDRHVDADPAGGLAWPVVAGRTPALPGGSAVTGSRYPTGGRVPPGYLPVPAHPWQAQDLLAPGDGPLGDLLADGLLVDLGVSGPSWYPTTSVRTVWRPDSPVMLKLSLGLRITNSRRNLQRGELRLAEMITGLVDAGLGRELAGRHPSFRLIGEPEWVAVVHPDLRRTSASGAARGNEEADLSTDVPGGHSDHGALGLETAFRTNPFGQDDRVACGAALVAPRPDRATGSRGRAREAMLARILSRLAERHHEPIAALADAWFARYLDVLVVPLLDLFLRFGVGVEAHLQNTLVSLDDDGWPVAGWYRDSQGYYVAESAVVATEAMLPGFATGLDVVFDDALITERIIYYLFVNNVFALVGALGAAGIVAESRLLGRLRDLLGRLERAARLDHGPQRPPRSRRRLLTILLTDATLPSKGNLRTCVDGRDELIGPVATQSVYVQIPNPLLEAAA
ncbi:IucA/IucC family protein [Frankia sp. AgB32]|uniref:IucA/IucC family protein n=1 Tax=Frankia sp. AgB32 TaxID=631119 RepID=UPI00200F4DCD|nr:IucA/IucC family protein [Frankia sp. AgB32]MCK9893071.1 siderophore synthetase [Frankia sp. AgB32]